MAGAEASLRPAAIFMDMEEQDVKPLLNLSNREGWNNDSLQGFTMDSASTLDKPGASLATDNHHPDRKFSYSVIHCYLRQKSYPANFT